MPVENPGGAGGGADFTTQNMEEHADIVLPPRHNEVLVYELTGSPVSNEFTILNLETPEETFIETSLTGGFVYDDTTYAPATFAKVDNASNGSLIFAIDLPGDAYVTVAYLDMWIASAGSGTPYVTIQTDTDGPDPHISHRWQPAMTFYSNELEIFGLQGGRVNQLKVNTHNAEVEVYGIRGYYYTPGEGSTGEWKVSRVSRPGHRHHWAALDETPEWIAEPSTTNGHVLKIVGGVPTWAAP